MIDNSPVYFQITEKRRCANRLTPCCWKQRYKTITSLFAFLLLFFITSCNQPSAIQAEETSELVEQIGEIRNRPTTTDSIHLLLNTLWAENAHRMTTNEKIAFYKARSATYRAAHDLEAAVTNLQQAVYYLARVGDFGRQAQTMAILGSIRMSQMELDEALDIFRQAITLIENDPDQTALLLNLYHSKVVIYMHRGETGLALNYNQLMLGIATQEGFPQWEASALKHLAASFIYIEDFAQAEENLRRAISIFSEYNNQRMLWLAYHHLASVLFRKGRLEEGLMYAKKSDEAAAAIGMPLIGMAAYYEQRGRIYLEDSNYDNSLAKFYQALELRREMQDIGVMGEMKNEIGEIYRRMGNFDTAYSYLDIARSIAQENSLLRLEADVQGNLAIIYAVRGDMDNFLTAIKTKRKLRQEVFNEQNTRALQEMQVRYETEIKQLLIAQQAEEIRYTHRRNVFLSIILVLIVAFSVITFLFYRRKMQEIRTTVRHYEELLKYRKGTQPKSKNDVQDPTLNEISQRLIPQIEHLFKEEKIYKQQGLSLDDVAKMLDTNRSYLSAAVNDYYQKKFPEFVNTFRIDDAIEMFKEQREGGKYANYTIQAIGEEVGFVGKTTFYSAFKQIVGVTPSEYLKMLVE